MSESVNPYMLVIAREAAGMSQSALATAISVTQGKISKYENGMLAVSSDDLRAIARALTFTEEFFLEKGPIHGLGSSFLFHRKRKTAPILVQKQIQAKINVLAKQIERLMRGAELETPCRFQPIDIDSQNGNVEKIARLVRGNWNLPIGAVANVTEAIELAGGIVLTCQFNTRAIDAAHLWLPGLPPMFFVNRDMPGDRLRWTLAHEIGHAVMHSSATGDIEREADLFASEFLLPAEEIDHHLDAMTLEKAAIMKQQWRVSMAAIIRTAFERGRMNKRRYRALFTSLGAQGYRTTEPYPIAIEEPRVAKELVELHRANLGYSDFDLAQLLFSPDPQFFADQPNMLRINNRPFFSFVKESRPNLRLSM